MIVDPLLPISDGMGDTRTLLVSIAGTVANGALLATVAALILGLIMWGFGTALNIPGLASRGVQTLFGAVVCAIVCTGLNSWVAWFGEQAISIWN